MRLLDETPRRSRWSPHKWLIDANSLKIISVDLGSGIRNSAGPRRDVVEFGALASGLCRSVCFVAGEDGASCFNRALRRCQMHAVYATEVRVRLASVSTCLAREIVFSRLRAVVGHLSGLRESVTDNLRLSEGSYRTRMIVAVFSPYICSKVSAYCRPAVFKTRTARSHTAAVARLTRRFGVSTEDSAEPIVDGVRSDPPVKVPGTVIAFRSSR